MHGAGMAILGTPTPAQRSPRGPLGTAVPPASGSPGRHLDAPRGWAGLGDPLGLDGQAESGGGI